MSKLKILPVDEQDARLVFEHEPVSPSKVSQALNRLESPLSVVGGLILASGSYRCLKDVM
jgi:hypothetical protein